MRRLTWLKFLKIKPRTHWRLHSKSIEKSCQKYIFLSIYSFGKQKIYLVNFKSTYCNYYNVPNVSKIN